MQSQDTPNHRPPLIPHRQDQLKSCKLPASCSRPLVSSVTPDTHQDTLQNLHSEEPNATPQKHHDQSIPPPSPQGQMSASRPSVVPKIPPITPQTPHMSPSPPEDLGFQDMQFKSTDIRLRQPKEVKDSHPLLVNTAVKKKVIDYHCLYILYF